MASWSNNNRAHALTWMALRVMEQNSKIFKESGDLRMDQLAYWSTVATDQMRDLQASALAAQMDNMFRMVSKAKYETGVDQNVAIESIRKTLVTGDKTVSELGELNDDNYEFLGEPADG